VTARRDSGSGFALIVVLWFLVLIASISAYLVANARQETAIARNIAAAAKAEALADAGIAQAAFNQAGSVEELRWKLDGAPHRIPVPGGEVTIRLFDETQKLNPNLASDDLLGALFEAAGAERPVARRAGAAIADWVDRDNDARPLGAEREDYAAAGRTYRPPNLQIETLDELLLVLDVTPELLALARPHLTIHSHVDRPDGMGASPVIQRALLLAPATGDGTLAEGVRQVARSDDPTLTADQRAATEAAEQEAALREAEESAGARIFAVEATARAASGGIFVREAVIRIAPTAPKGYVVLDWRRGETISD
jgi:general secretion pathway protein K